MTAELLSKGYLVTAVDRAPLDPRLEGATGLRFVAADAASFRPPTGARYDAILSDMNGDPADAMARVLGFAVFLSAEGVVVFTLKLPETVDLRAMLGTVDAVVSLASGAGLQVFHATHLAYNRHELTLFLHKGRPAGKPL
jgi:23S rRNA C2498 (ribose-2'-O)-methylase RlmM